MRHANSPFNADLAIFGLRLLTLVNRYAEIRFWTTKSVVSVEDKEFSLDRGRGPEVSISLPRAMHFAIVRIRPASTNVQFKNELALTSADRGFWFGAVGPLEGLQ